MTRFGCPHVACPGCALIDSPIEAQLARKQARLADALRAHPELASTPVEPIVAARPITGYRTRAKWAVGADGAIGLYTDGDTHEIVDVPGCVVAAPPILETAATLRRLAFAGAEGRPALASMTAVDLREVDTEAGGRLLVTFVITDRADAEPARALARKLLEASPGVVGVFASMRDPQSPQMLGSSTIELAGRPSAVDRIGSVKVFATPGSFVQAHRGQARAIEDRLVAFVRGLDVHAPRVLELYAGSGAFSLALAAAGARVTAVESFPPAARAIGDAAALARLSLEIAQADAEAYLLRAPEAFDVVVVDPPRRGLPPGLREAIADRGPRAIAYVSCDPDTLARDLAHFARLGYRTTSATPLDMIPLSDHVEAIVTLTRGERPEPVPTRRPGDLVALETGMSGARIDDAAAIHARAEIDAEVACFVTGVTRGKGKILAWKGGIATYQRLGVHAGHSELRIRVEGHGAVRLGPILDRLAKFGHPPLGDPKRGAPPAVRWAFEALGLDRPYVHVLSVRARPPGSKEIVAESPLAADLASVRRRLHAAKARNHSVPPP